MPFTMLKARVKDTLAVHKRPTLQKGRTIQQKRKSEFNQLIYFISRTVQSQKVDFSTHSVM